MTRSLSTTCQECQAEFDVEYIISGRVRRATMESPAEYPDIEVLTDVCPEGHAVNEDDSVERIITAFTEELGAQYDEC
jgi:hypothetical protein